jgi:cell division septum initiation protein DivIVA
MKDYVIILERRIQSLEDVAHEPQNYKEKCDQMEERIKVLEDKLNEKVNIKKSSTWR